VVGLTLEAIGCRAAIGSCAASIPRMGPWRPRWWGLPGIACS
jgi:hypothetical protein